MPIDKTPWTDDTVMPWGDHEGTKLREVPKAYLAWLFAQSWISSWPGLHSYLKSHADELRSTSDGEDSGPEGYSSYQEFRDDLFGF